MYGNCVRPNASLQISESISTAVETKLQKIARIQLFQQTISPSVRCCARWNKCRWSRFIAVLNVCCRCHSLSMPRCEYNILCACIGRNSSRIHDYIWTYRTQAAWLTAGIFHFFCLFVFFLYSFSVWPGILYTYLERKATNTTQTMKRMRLKVEWLCSNKCPDKWRDEKENICYHT